MPADSEARQERSWEKVNKTGECWVWTGATKGGGYGNFTDYADGAKRHVLAHRFSWELHNGPVPAEKPLVLHHCDNPPCVRPDHLFVGTHRDNITDAIEKGRFHGRKQGQLLPGRLTTAPHLPTRRQVRFFLHRVRHVDECSIWTGGRRFYWIRDGIKHSMPPERVMWMIWHGPVAPGEKIYRRCGDPACIRPGHLYLATNEIATAV